MSASTSPHKGDEATTASAESPGWVKFDEADGSAPSDDQNSPVKTRTSRSSSGVSSARGSVQSVVNPALAAVGSGGGVLPVSEVEVVDEHSLRKKVNSEAENAGTPVFRQMSSRSSSQSAQMDTVNLSDDGTSPARTETIRGRRFSKY